VDSRVSVPSWFPSFARRLGIAIVVVAVLTTAGVVAVDAMGRNAFHNTPVVNVNVSPSYPGKPANYLLVGVDQRDANDPSAATVTGARSDVIMVLHIEPQTKKGILVSFPRDLLVHIDGRLNLLNSAYGLGGPNKVIQVLQDNFAGLKIQHYLEVNFDGFKSIVNAVGHIKLYFPTPAHDPLSGLNVDQSGCVSVNGDTALAYARSRHYYVPRNLANPAPWTWNYDPQVSNDSDSPARGGQGWVEDGQADLDRIPRQQYFLRTIGQSAIEKTTSDPTKLLALFNAVDGSFKRDRDLTFSEIKALIRTFRGLDPHNIEMLTLPTDPSPYRQFPGQRVPNDESIRVVSRLRYFTPPAPEPTPLPPSQVSVRIVNGSKLPGVEQRAIDQFTAAGFHVIGGASNAERSDYTKTQLAYAPNLRPAGLSVARAAQTINVVEANSRADTLNADVLVVIGADYDTLPHAFPGAPGVTTPTTAAAPQNTTSTTSTTVALPPPATPDSRYVPLDPKTHGPLVGCPS
jgi:LCP family protein required for cell wall assembly